MRFIDPPLCRRTSCSGWRSEYWAPPEQSPRCTLQIRPSRCSVWRHSRGRSWSCPCRFRQTEPRTTQTYCHSTWQTGCSKQVRLSDWWVHVSMHLYTYTGRGKWLLVKMKHDRPEIISENDSGWKPWIKLKLRSENKTHSPLNRPI